MISVEGWRNAIAVGISRGNAFTWQPDWKTGIAVPDAFAVGDFNGDGSADIVSYEAWNGGALYVGTSTGTAFGWARWAEGLGAPAYLGAGNVNGDGRDDVISVEGWRNAIAVGISRGNAFTWQPNWKTGIAVPDAFAPSHETGGAPNDPADPPTDDPSDTPTSPGTPPPPQGAGFTDIADSPHRDSIVAVSDAGIAGGYSDGTFRPNTAVTRGQMATFLAGALHLQPSGTGPFGDVARSPHHNSIVAVSEAGIAGGYPDERSVPTPQ